MAGPAQGNGPMGDLPPVGTTRWVARRKAQVVAAVRSGVITLDEACRMYALTVEELAGWQSSVDRHGIDALKATHLQKYRGAPALA